jgi:hypothetical protein
MPNWCKNSLQIIGRQNEIDQCLESLKVEKSAFDFNTVIPRPEKYAGRGNESGATIWNDWLTWCARNWGTKWNAHDPEVDSITGELCFYTAHAPPTPVLLALSKKFPRLSFDLK